jgi:SAM-dependent methyltransferase
MNAGTSAHGTSSASAWVQRWSHLLAPNATVLDVACGAGRHLTWFAARGHPVTGIDRDTTMTAHCAPTATLVTADIENAPWPLMMDGAPQQFDALVVTHYLWRPLFPTLLDSVAPGGLLLYETFAAGNESIGRPSRPDFLLQPGELLRLCADWHVVAFEQGFLDNPERFVQRIAALRPFTHPETGAVPTRHPL